MVPEVLSKSKLHCVLHLFSLYLLLGCSGSTNDLAGDSKQKEESSTLDSTPAIVAMDPGNDEFWYHLVYQLETNKFLGIAEPVEPIREGIRLQIFTLYADSSINILAESSPGYDSQVYLPRFIANPLGGYFLLTHMGERESWGLKVIGLANDTFSDIGYIDAAFRIPNENLSDGEPKSILTNISDYVTLTYDGHIFRFDFTCDSVYIYSDGSESLEKSVPNSAYHYEYNGESFLLVESKKIN